MPDGWKLYTETWAPDGDAKAVLLFQHGWMECTVRALEGCDVPRTRGVAVSSNKTVRGCATW